MRYIVTTGWWCDGSDLHAGVGKNASSPLIRRPAFFPVWHDFVSRYSDPAKIVVVDSASPVRPMLPSDDRIEFISLTRNFGHAFHPVGRWSGWTRAFFLGMWYGLLSDADYVVFVEQDCLVCGDGIIEAAIANMRGHGISHGLWDHKVGVEQSLVIVDREYVTPFATEYLSIDETDARILPEQKFEAVHRRHGRFVALPFGYGRNRPINFSDRHFYAQHWTRDELSAVNALAPGASLGALLADAGPGAAQ